MGLRTATRRAQGSRGVLLRQVVELLLGIGWKAMEGYWKAMEGYWKAIGML